MTTPLVFAVPSEADWPSIEALLTASALPADGARAHLSTFLVARRGATIVAVAGTECYGETALLRSVTTAERRGGLGQEIVLRVLDDAHWRGVRTVFLLTTTAATFFPRFGFHVVPRGEMSAAVRQSVEFGAICASATAMRLDLTTRPIVVRRATDADAPSVATCLAWASPAHRPFEGPCTADAVLVWMRTGGAGLTVVVAATVDGPAGAAWFECAGPRPPYDSTAAADLCVAPDMAVHVPVRLGDELARRARASGFVALRAHCVADPLRTTLLRASGFHEAGTHWVRGGADHAAVVARVFERPVGGGTAAGGEASASTLDVLHDELTALLGRRVSRAPSVREIHGRDESPYPPCLPDLVAFPATTDEVSAIVTVRGTARRPGRRLRGGHLARRARAARPRRRHDRPGPDDGSHRDERRRPRRAGAGRRDAHAARAPPAQHRARVLRRSRRGRDAGRHGLDPCLRHDRRPLRHHARERARPHRRPRGRPRDPDWRARAQVVRRLRFSRACSSARKARSASLPR